MKRLFLLVALFSGIAAAQMTTSITGTIKDLSNAVLTSGKVTFTLTPSRDMTISGMARFSPQTITCLINGLGAIVALDGVSVCTIIMNTALQPPGSYYTVGVWPANVKTSTFTFYAVLSSYDWSTVVPTPTTSPAQNFVDIFSNQTIGGNKIWSGTHAFNQSVSFPGTITGTTNAGRFNLQSLNSSMFSDQSASLKAAIATVVSNGTGGNVYMPPGFNAALSGSSTLQLGDGNVPVVLEMMPGSSINVSTTGGVDAICVGNGSIIHGPGILPHSTSAYGATIRLVNGHAIANLITNCDKSGNQETASVDGVYIVDPGTTGTMTGAAIDFTSVFANSRVWNTVVDHFATPQIRIQNTSGQSASVISILNDWSNCEGLAGCHPLQILSNGTGAPGLIQVSQGAYEHPPAGTPSIEVNGGSGTSQAIGNIPAAIDIGPLYIEGVAASTIGIKVADAWQIHVHDILCGGLSGGGSDCLQVTQAGSRTSNVWASGIAATGWTNLIHDLINTRTYAVASFPQGLTLWSLDGAIITGGQIVSHLPRGTAPFAVDSTTGVANLISQEHPTVRLCGTTTTCTAFSNNSAPVISTGTVALAAGTATITGLSYSSTSSFNCVANDVTTSSNAVKMVPASATTATVTGTGTDVISYHCDGN
jgi:hypothetical protein